MTEGVGGEIRTGHDGLNRRIVRPQPRYKRPGIKFTLFGNGQIARNIDGICPVELPRLLQNQTVIPCSVGSQQSPSFVLINRTEFSFFHTKQKNGLEAEVLTRPYIINLNLNSYFTRSM